MKRASTIFAKILLWLVISVVFIAVCAITISYAFENRIKKLAINELNKHLIVPVKIDSKNITLSLLNHFPYASLSFKNFSMRESYKHSEKNFADVKSLSLVFNPLNLLNGNYTVDKAYLTDATIIIKYDMTGTPNFNFWKSEPADSNTPSEFVLKLKKIAFKNVDVSYIDEPTDQFLTGKIINSKLNGNFSASAFDLNTDAKISLTEYTYDKVTYASNKYLRLLGILKVDLDKNSYVFQNTKLEFESTAFDVTGKVNEEKDGFFIDWKVNGRQSDIQTFLSFMPSEYEHYIKEFRSEGSAFFNTTITGLVNKSSLPKVNVKFGLRDARIFYRSNQLYLDKVNLDGTYSNGQSQNLTTSELIIPHFSAVLNGKSVEGKLTLNNFLAPSIDMAAKGEVLLSDLTSFMDVKDVRELKGSIKFDVAYKGEVASFDKIKKRGNVTSSGSIELIDVSVLTTSSDIPYKNISGIFNFNGDALNIKALTATIKSSDLMIDGTIMNLASFVFSKETDLNLEGTIKSKYINVEDFITESGTTKDTVYTFVFPDFLNGTFNVRIDKLIYQKLKTERLSGVIKVSGPNAILTNGYFSALNGLVYLEGSAKVLPNGRLQTHFRSNLNKINVNQLFYQLDNFSQNYLTHKHIKGNLSGKMDCTINWNPDLSADLNSIVAIADISIDNGELNRFEPLMDLGKFLKIKSLDNLVFDNLSNTITIRKQLITIPDMEVQSSALNMAIAGTHTFSNYMDYKISANISQLLFGKRQDYEDEFGVVEVDENGGARLFLSMKGPGDNPVIKYDVTSSRQNVTNSFKKEKEELKEVFSKPVDENNKPEELNNNSEVKLGWDDKNVEEEQTETIPHEPSKTEQEQKKAFDKLRKKISTKP